MNLKPLPKKFSMDAFFTPEQQHAPIYAWVWNAACSHEETDAQLDEMQRLGIRAFYIIPEPQAFRPKTMPTELVPDYLTPEYFEEYAYAIRSAQKRGMQCWLYDEGGWPSGGACGKVLAAHPETNKRVLCSTEYQYHAGDVYRKKNPDTIAVFIDGATQISEGYIFSEEKIAVEYYSEAQTKFGPAGPYSPDYPDLTREDSTQYFIEMTHDKYREAIGDTFGDHVFAMFTDEPKAPGPLPFRAELMAEYEAQYGESIVPYLPLLAGKIPASEENAYVLRRWYDMCSHKFCDTFLNACRDWCHENKLVFTGHMDKDDVPDGCVAGGCNYHLMRALRCFDIPGIDVIWRQIFPGKSYKTPTGELVAENGFFPRYASSAMAQTGGDYAVTETLGVYGSGVTYHVMRYCFGYQAIRGINIFNMMVISYGRHGFLLAAEQPGFNEAFPYHADMAVFNRYLERLSYICSIGDRVCDTALYFPVNDFWGRMRGGAFSRAFDALGREMEDRMIDFDVVDDDVFAQASGIDDGWIRIGKAAYRTLVIPEGAYLPEHTKEVLARFQKGGGRVYTSAEALMPEVAVSGTCERVRAMRRVLENGTLFCLFNENEIAADFHIQVPQGNTYRMDLENGVLMACDVSDEGVHVQLGEGETTAILVTNEVLAIKDEPRIIVETITPDVFTIRRVNDFSFGEDTIETHTYDDAPKPAVLGDWAALLGEDFSGSAVYETTFACSDLQNCGGCIIDLGNVQHTCEVVVNGNAIGVKVMSPYRFWVPANVLRGNNQLAIRVTNTPSNQYLHTAFFDQFESWQLSPYFEKELLFMRDSLPSGLWGPVRILIYE